MMADYRPGDIANGHILVEGEGWVPLAVYKARAHMTQETPTPLAWAPGPGPSGAEPNRRPWYMRTWLIAVAAGLLGLILGSAAAESSEAPDPTTSAEYQALEQQLDEARSELADAESALGDLPAAQDQLEADREEVAEQKGDLAAGQKALDEREKELGKREKAVGLAEAEVASNTIPGEGMFKVGPEMKPGTYKTIGKRGCYYAVLNSTDTFDIAVNGNPDGPAFATVAVGQYFESSGCADWVLQQ